MRGATVAMLAGLLVSGGANAQQASPTVQDAAPSNASLRQAPPQDASAPRTAPGTSDPIIVTGRPLPSKDDIRGMIRAITPPGPLGEPLPRFNDSVCFGSMGLDRPTLIAIGDRLAADAEEAGLRLGGDRCKPNIIILFVDDVSDEIDHLVKRKWWVFGNRSPSEIRGIVGEQGPVRAWSNNEVRSRDGDRIDQDGYLRVPTASRIVASIRKDMLASVVLVERSAVIGKTPNQIADYLAMRALAGARPRQTGDKDTILALFEAKAGNAPAELTTFDRGYLRGLYAGQANAFARSTQGQIVRRILQQKDAEVTQAAKP